MKKLFLIAICLLTWTAQAGGNKHQVTVVVKNIKASTGEIRAGLYVSESSFLKEGVYVSQKVTGNDELTLVFDHVEAGVYAVSIYHDENANGELDTWVFGIPAEPYGFSNDAKGSYGPPSFADAQFEVATDQNITITLH
ncbi:DUF2141 domain-containing protein [Reichenbachiella agarivorans]|uniref:DUF2141 domain-containing protein n=1 Tax=Reichenbachiella agarivorans TaxID=2979464 RepID=A0ABY6CL06_9BACT|nr:DUF2141 domain-containing protein [Reichenbachiella agarivorans]UXP31206.1 DUF2141 domain-containing protein [Reichenbachiella agarivorans]